MEEETCLSELQDLKTKLDNELDHVMKFWLAHSHDSVNGGFFTCLHEDGSIYDETKYGWLQGRQVWMYCKLYNERGKYHTEAVLDAAIKGGDFLLKHVRRPEDKRCYFMTTCNGEPIKLQRTIFSECFYIMAMSGLYQATKEAKYMIEAHSVLSCVLYWVHVDASALGHLQLAGAISVNTLSIPMMIMCVLNEVCWDNECLKLKYDGEINWAVQEILKHIQRNATVIMENVSLQGKEIPGSQGRLVNPGHAIEAGWFLLQHATLHGNSELKQTAIEKFIELPYALGWDSQNLGLFYFLDVDGFSPTQLEWSMKLWWPHCEALIAFLMAYKETQEKKHFATFKKVLEYVLSHFSDEKHGEWYGYLNQKGEITHKFKGGPFKGCFHVPRALLMCSNILDDLINEMN